MLTQSQHQQPDEPRQRKPSWTRLIIVIAVVLVMLIASIFWIRYGGTPWYAILPTVILTSLGIVIALFQWLFPVSNNENRPLEIHHIHTVEPAPLVAPPAPPLLRDGQPSSVFLFNVPLADHREFYGRTREYRTLMDRMGKIASTSIVGERKIGKTWLLKYLVLNGHAELSNRFRVGYLDATLPSCKNVARFTAHAMEQLGSPPSSSHRDLDYLERFVRSLRQKGLIPVLCIDEFEGFTTSTGFGLDFFHGLRALAQEGLVLVVASKRPLIDIVGEPGETSGFFNIFEQFTLKPFSLNEAKNFAAEKGSLAGFTAQENTTLLQYGQFPAGQWPPLRLQLVGSMLLSDKLAARDDPMHYRPNDSSYWNDFEQRLEEKYRGAVR